MSNLSLVSPSSYARSSRSSRRRRPSSSEMGQCAKLTAFLLFLSLANIVASQRPKTFELPRHSLPSGRRPEPGMFNIGAVVNPPDSTHYFTQAIEDAAALHNLKLYAQTVHMNSNPIRIAQSVCDNLISQQVFAVVISHPTQGELSPSAVSYTCGFYNVPVIGISSRHSSMSDKNLHKTFLRTVPPYSHQADVWVELLKKLQYRSVVFIHTSDNDGRATLGRFQNLVDPATITIEHVIEYEVGRTNISEQFESAKKLHCRVFVLYADTEDAEYIFSKAVESGMAEPSYVWIVSEQALKASNVIDGVLGLDLVNASDEKAHIHDSVNIIALALKKLRDDPTMTPPHTNCSLLGQTWESGIRLVNLLKHQVLQKGETGHVRFDDKGDRLFSDYDIINIAKNGQPVIVGQYAYFKWEEKMKLAIDAKLITWPGNQTEKPLGFVIPKHLRVSTIAAKPFVWVRRVDSVFDCDENEIVCPWLNKTDNQLVPYCCKGYCMDLLKELAKQLNFTYSLYQVQDGQYGIFDFHNGSKVKKWNGMVGDLVYGRADMILAPLTITPERSMDIDFTKPFKYQGITILAKKQDKSSTLASFLQPFQKTLWILVMVSVHVVALALYLLDRFSPFGRYKLPNSDATEEDALNLSSAIWFAWGVLLNSGIAEGTPRSFSGRVLGMVWAGFAMIVVASYTANLAAFLVLEKPESSLSGINDPRLRNPSENFTYATVKGSAVDMYFRRQVELSNMYRIMEGKNFDTVEEGIDALMNNQLDAFIWDSSRLEFEAAQHCELVTAGEQFGRSGYGIGLQRNSFWVDRVTLTLLEMHESGYMEALDKKWISGAGAKCESKNERTPATLGLTNMAGVFILVGAGIVGGIGLIVIEIIYKRHQTRKQRRLEIARHAADKWRGAVEKRRSYRHRMPLPRSAYVTRSLPLPSHSSLDDALGGKGRPCGGVKANGGMDSPLPDYTPLYRPHYFYEPHLLPPSNRSVRRPPQITSLPAPVPLRMRYIKQLNQEKQPSYDFSV